MARRVDFSGGVEGAIAPLGNSTVFASRRKRTETIEEHQYRLLDFLGSRLPHPDREWDEENKKWKHTPGWRVTTCRRIPVMGHDVEVVRTAGGAAFRGLNHCDSVWTCPVCSSRIAKARREELTAAVAGDKVWVALSTFTIRHHLGDRLEDLIHVLREASRRMRSGRSWQYFTLEHGYVGSYTSFEFTWSSENGWHPHLHSLDVFVKPLSHEEQNVWRHEVERRWISAVEAITGKQARRGEYEHSYTFMPSLSSNQALVQAYYACKWGSSEEQWSGIMKRKAKRAGTTGLLYEVTGNRTKEGRMLAGTHYSSWELLELASEGDERAWGLWLEFAQATKLLHQGTWSRGLKDWLSVQEVPDAEIPEVAESEDPEVVAVIECHQWMQLLHHRGVRGHILALVAAGGSAESVWNYVDSVLGVDASVIM